MRVLGFLLLTGALQAGEGAAYLKIPQGARLSAMASASAAIQGSAEGLWFTPVAVQGLRDLDLSLSRMAWIGETHNDYLALAFPLGSRQGLGLYGNLVSTEDVYRDNLGNDGAKFGNSALVLGGAYSLRLGPLALGLGVKQFQENWGGLNTSRFVYDGGMQLSFAKGAFRLGSSAQNLGPDLGYSLLLGEVRTPAIYRVGMAWRPGRGGLLVSGEYRIIPESQASATAAGAEYAFGAPSLRWALRGGYQSSGTALGGLGGLTLGGGLCMAGLSADFAWLPQGSLGNPYRMSLGWNFAAAPGPPPGRASDAGLGPPPPLPEPLATPSPEVAPAPQAK